MTQKEFQSFLSVILSQENTSTFFWNMMHLANNEVSYFWGPKTQQEYEHNVATRQNYSEKSKQLDKIAMDFYNNLQSPDVQTCLKWVVLLSPLVARYDQLNLTDNQEMDNYGFLLRNIKVFASEKLKHDVIVKIIEHLPRQNRLDDKLYNLYKLIIKTLKVFDNPKYKYSILTAMVNRLETRDELDDKLQLLYAEVCLLRAKTDYALSEIPSVQENRMQDLYVAMRAEDSGDKKLKYAKQIVKILIQKLERTIKTTDKNLEPAVRDVCNQARKYVAGVSAINQDYMDKVWDTFDYHKIMSIPEIAQKRSRK